MGRIVVGVDGSQPADAALDWAIAEAELRNSSLEIVVSWDYPVMAGAEPVYIAPPDMAELKGGAARTADSMLAHCRSALARVNYSVVTPEGRPGEVLVEQAEGADLLVVGSHGSGVVKELLLGSVSNYCAHHSPCPVVIVRKPTDVSVTS